jgi:hypothetical protein
MAKDAAQLEISLISGCLVGDYHWFSLKMLQLYLDSAINTGEFLRWFHMPDSAYLTTSECIAATIDPAWDYRDWKPGALDGYGPGALDGYGAASG